MKAATAVRPAQQLPRWAKITLIAAGVPLFLGALSLLPLAVPPYLDFQVLYQTNMGLLRGIAIYDHAGQVQMIAQLAHVAPDQVIVLPFPYPPWYALATAWLAWLPIEAAARVWFGISLLSMLAAAALLTEGWPLIKRVAAFVAAFFFLPVLGSLLVGQYGFPVLLGAALMVYALRHDKAALAALAAMLLTFKPHLGGLLLLAAFIYLLQRTDAFGRRAMRSMLLAGAALFLAGFLADRLWPVDYIRSLVGFQSDSGVASCGLCASLPALIGSRLSAGRGLGLAVIIAILGLLLLGVLWLRRRRELVHHPFRLLAATSLVVLVASPYLLNYDFLLLLVPLALLAGEKQRPMGWVLLAIIYLLPYAALGVLGREGNFVYPLCAILLMLVLYWKPRLLDVSVAAS